MTIARQSLLEWSPDELAKDLELMGLPAFRATQIYDWIFGKGVFEFAGMTTLPGRLRSELDERFSIRNGTVVRRSVAADGTLKLLLQWRDGATTECVMIPAGGERRRRTVCLSTQVGCDVGCRFCASGLDGALRNLTVGEVLEQALAVQAELRQREERLSHVVFMGMGEPLANYRVTVEAVRRLNAAWAFGIAQRRITISTVGLPKQIERLAAEGLQTTLALSLHAAREGLRKELIPWAQRLTLDELLRSCRTYFGRTGREVTLEYCLLAGVNDGTEDLAALARIAFDLRAHVNLLMYNPVESLPYERPSSRDARAFLSGLRSRGVNATLRRSRGIDTDAACGQLRRRHLQR